MVLLLPIRNELYGYSQQSHDYLHNIELRLWIRWLSHDSFRWLSKDEFGLWNELRGERIKDAHGHRDLSLPRTNQFIMFSVAMERLYFLDPLFSCLYIFELLYSEPKCAKVDEAYIRRRVVRNLEERKGCHLCSRNWKSPSHNKRLLVTIVVRELSSFLQLAF
ncbi:hypothetical protein Tco_0163580 [Tanacetum coccineum]